MIEEADNYLRSPVCHRLAPLSPAGNPSDRRVLYGGRSLVSRSPPGRDKAGADWAMSSAGV